MLAKGMIMMVRKAGMASVGYFHIRKKPARTRAGASAELGIMLTRGNKNRARSRSAPVNTADKPVRPPPSFPLSMPRPVPEPATLSTRRDTGAVPKKAATTAPIAADKKAGKSLGMSPTFSFPSIIANVPQ
jgi:hypothetical protein